MLGQVWAYLVKSRSLGALPVRKWSLHKSRYRMFLQTWRLSVMTLPMTTFPLHTEGPLLLFPCMLDIVIERCIYVMSFLVFMHPSGVSLDASHHYIFRGFAVPIIVS